MRKKAPRIAGRISNPVTGSSYPVLKTSRKMTDKEKETLLFGSPICQGCGGLGHLYAASGSPYMPDCPSGYADNWRRCFYCRGSGSEKPPCQALIDYDSNYTKPCGQLSIGKFSAPTVAPMNVEVDLCAKHEIGNRISS